MLIIQDEQQIRRAVTMPRAIEVLEAMAREMSMGRTQQLPRIRLKTHQRMLHILPAGADVLGYSGLKAYSTGGPHKDFWYLLFDENGLKALLCADFLGRIRTGAASGLATKLLARGDANILGIVGAGSQAFTQVEAIAAVRQLSRVLVFSRDVEKRKKLAYDIETQLGLQATAVENIRDAVVGVDILVTVTSAREAIIDGNWIQPGTHINAVGSNQASHRELDDEALRRCSHIVVEDVQQARNEAGDLLRAQHCDWSRVALLSDTLVSKRFKRSAQDVTLFKGLGIGLWDLALAVEIVTTTLNEAAGGECVTG